MIRIGISLSGREFNANEIAHYSEEARRAGAASVWLPSVPEFRDGLEIANRAMASVHNFTIGLSVVSIYSRSPLSLASSVATLIEKSSNQLIVGVGAGDPKWRIGLGSQVDRPIAFMSEYLDVLSKLLNGRRFTFRGTFYRLVDAQLRIPIRQVPKIYVGATGERMIELASRKAQGLILNGALSFEYFDKIKSILPKRDAERSNFQVVWPFATSLAADEKNAKRKVKPFLLSLLTSGKVSPIVEASPFFPILKKIGKQMARGEYIQALQLISDEVVDYFSISGTAETCARRIRDLSSWGNFLPVLYPVKTDPLLMLRSLIKKL